MKKIISHNKISKLQLKVFNELDKLRKINLEYNEKEFIETSQFQGFFNLEDLYFQENQLAETVANILKKISKPVDLTE